MPTLEDYILGYAVPAQSPSAYPGSIQDVPLDPRKTSSPRQQAEAEVAARMFDPAINAVADPYRAVVKNDPKAQKRVLEKVAQFATDPTMGITTYHGSPTSGIKKFDMNFRGTGEGRLAPDSPQRESFKDMIAHGLYTAENKGIAKGYQERLQDNGFGVSSHFRDFNPLYSRDEVEKAAGKYLYDTQDVDKAISKAMEYSGNTEVVAKLMDWKQNWTIGYSKPGSTYTAELLPHPDEYLHWDKPLSEQPEVLEKLKAAGTFEHGGAESYTGRSLHAALEQGKTSKQVAEQLESLGIKGVKYLDGSSRNTNSKVSRIWENEKKPNAPQWRVSSPNGTMELYKTEQEALKAAEAFDAELLKHNYVTFRPEAESIITHENGQRLPGMVEEAYAKVRDPQSKKTLEQRYPELLERMIENASTPERKMLLERLRK